MNIAKHRNRFCKTCKKSADDCQCVVLPSPGAHAEMEAYGWSYTGKEQDADCISAVYRNERLEGQTIIVYEPPAGPYSPVRWLHQEPGNTHTGFGIDALRYNLMTTNKRNGIGTLQNGFTAKV